MVPGSPAPLIKVCTGGDNLLLLYGDDRARLWDVKTLEFWRSMNIEKAKELLNQGGWAELSVTVYIVVARVILTSMGQVVTGYAFGGKRPFHAICTFT